MSNVFASVSERQPLVLLFGVVLKPFRSNPLLGAISFGWGLAALCDHLVCRKASKQLDRPPFRTVTQQEYENIYGEPLPTPPVNPDPPVVSAAQQDGQVMSLILLIYMYSP